MMTTNNLHGKNLVAGRHAAGGTAKLRAFNPAAGAELEPDFTEATPGEVEEAVSEAERAFRVYRQVDDEARAHFLEAIAAEIEALGDSLLERCQAETALPLARLQGERGRTCGQLRLFARVVREGSWVDARIDPALPERQPLARPDLRRMLRGIGPVAVLGASNFPLAFSVAGGDTASAFAAGCPVVVKAHPAHPGTSELVGEAIGRAAKACGLPAGIFSLVHGGAATAEALVRHPSLAAVGFTGSHRAGRALFDLAAAREKPIPVFAEMSSLNPVFLLEGALRERSKGIAEGLVNSMSAGVGQFCTKPGVVFVVKGGSADNFLREVETAARAVPAGLMLTPRIREMFARERGEILGTNGVSGLVAPDLAQTVKGGQTPAGVALTSLARFLEAPVLSREAFGPFTLVVLAETEAELETAAAALDGQLTATIHGTAEDLRKAAPLLEVLERKAGRVLFNGYPTGVEVSPAMQHGGPYPSTSDARFTSVGTAAMLRFARPICYQNCPPELLPEALRNENPRGILRQVDGRQTRDPIN